MRRIILSLTVFVFALIASSAAAQDSTTVAVPADTTTTTVSPTIPSVPSTGSTNSSSGQGLSPQTGFPVVIPGQQGGNVGDEVSQLQREMEAKIKAIRTEYQAKITEARKRVQTARQTLKQNAKQNVRQNIKQNVKQNIIQNIKQNTGLETRQNLKQNLQQGGLPINSGTSNGGQFQPIQQQNPIGSTQEQFGPSTGSGSSSGGFQPQSGGSGGGGNPPPSSGGGGSAPSPFSSSVLQKFLPSYSW